ncbi:MAG: IS630 family transposase [Chloroflexota bacterium]|nr:IS630 family transposase [Chloroflexota bacterium]
MLLALERPGVFPPEQRAQVTAAACSLPNQLDCPLSRWSHTELARHLAQSADLPPVSPSTIQRWLRSECLRPWRFHSWQHIHSPELFLERARPVLQLYAQAANLLAEGSWVVCVDKKTSLQAREREQAPRGARQGKPMLLSPRYHRRGACQLFAGLSVADGKVFGTTRARKCFADFQAFVSGVMLEEARRRGVHKLVVILDNGPTHAPKQFEAWLRKEIAARGWEMEVEVAWLPTNASWLDQIEIWFSVLQRKLLQPNHFHSPEEVAESIEQFMVRYNETARPIKWTYTVQQLEQKLGMQS